VKAETFSRWRIRLTGAALLVSGLLVGSALLVSPVSAADPATSYAGNSNGSNILPASGTSGVCAPVPNNCRFGNVGAAANLSTTFATNASTLVSAPTLSNLKVTVSGLGISLGSMAPVIVVNHLGHLQLTALTCTLTLGSATT